MTAPSSIEVAWLEYARDVVLGDHHNDSCAKAGGGSLEIGGTADLRWPGYLGPGFRPGGLLLVGNVHRNFASDGVPEWVPSALIDATRSFRTDPTANGSSYLAKSRQAYERGLLGDDHGRNGWNVARPFRYILDGLGISWRDVAYTNGSKSQLVPGASLDALVKGCLDAWPVEELARTIGAAMVVTCSAIAGKRLEACGFPVERFPQRFSYARLDEIVGDLRSRGFGA